MFQPASVSLSGPAFSFLLYETCKATVRQYGFLLGEIVHKEITSITDNDQKQVDISKIIKINSVVPWPCSNYFPKGRVDKEKIGKLLGSNFSKVVAWYKYEPSSSIKFTLKDKAFHKQFREIFDIPQDLFSVCFLVLECFDTFSTYSYIQYFFRYYNSNYDKLNIYMPNLSESNNNYKNSEPASAVFSKILASIKEDIENTKGVVAVTEIQNSVQKYINKTGLELAEAEHCLFKLEEEINILKSSLKEEKHVVEKEQTNEEESKNVITFDNDDDNADNIPKKSETPRRSRKSFVSSDSNKDSQGSDVSSPEVQKKFSKTTKVRGRGRNK